MRTLLLGVAVTLLLVPPATAQGGEELWEITITLGPCEAFAEGNFTVLYAGSIGRYLVGELSCRLISTHLVGYKHPYGLLNG